MDACWKQQAPRLAALTLALVTAAQVGMELQRTTQALQRAAAAAFGLSNTRVWQVCFETEVGK